MVAGLGSQTGIKLDLLILKTLKNLLNPHVYSLEQCHLAGRTLLAREFKLNAREDTPGGES